MIVASNYHSRLSGILSLRVVEFSGNPLGGNLRLLRHPDVYIIYPVCIVCCRGLGSEIGIVARVLAVTIVAGGLGDSVLDRYARNVAAELLGSESEIL